MILVKNKYYVILIKDVVIISLFVLSTLFSHIYIVPLYYFEPIRIFILLSVFLTNKNNSIILAVILVFTSSIIVAHPNTLKAFLILTELILNIYILKYIFDKISNLFLSVCLSVFISKGIYYTLKWILITQSLINTELISTPILFQIFNIFLISFAIYYLFNKSALANVKD